MAAICVKIVRRLGRSATKAYAGSAVTSVKNTGFILTVVLSRRNYSLVQPQTDNSRIFSAVCVQRLPVITKAKSNLEISYEELQGQLELEHSALSEDEVQWEKILQRKKKIKHEDDDEGMAVRAFESEKKEFEEEQEEEWRKFVPGQRFTEADEVKDLRSLQRKLEETLVLLVKKQKDSTTWEAPQLEVAGTNETLQQVASRSLSQTCGAELNVRFLSNAPIAVMKNYQNKGSKVFFYKVNYVTGCVRLSEEYSDHIWVTKDEIKDFVESRYYNTLKRFLS